MEIFHQSTAGGACDGHGQEQGAERRGLQQPTKYDRTEHRKSTREPEYMHRERRYQSHNTHQPHRSTSQYHHPTPPFHSHTPFLPQSFKHLRHLHQNPNQLLRSRNLGIVPAVNVPHQPLHPRPDEQHLLHVRRDGAILPGADVRHFTFVLLRVPGRAGTRRGEGGQTLCHGRDGGHGGVGGRDVVEEWGDAVVAEDEVVGFLCWLSGLFSLDSVWVVRMEVCVRVRET